MKMIPRRKIMAAVVLAASLGLSSAPSQLHAGGQASDAAYVQVVAALQSEGFTIRKITSTFLGRIRIIAANGQVVREVVVSRSTGEIKSDMVIEVIGVAGAGTGTSGRTDQGGQTLAGSVGGGSGGSAGGTLGGAVDGAVDSIAGGSLGGSVGGAVDSVGDAVGGAVDSVGGAVDSLGGTLGGAVGGLGL